MKFAILPLALALAADPAVWPEALHYARNMPPAPVVVKTADGPGLQFDVAHFQPWHGVDWGTLTVSAHFIRYDSVSKAEESFNDARDDLAKVENGGMMQARGQVELVFRRIGDQRFWLADRPKHLYMHPEPLLAALDNFDAELMATGGGKSNPQTASTAPSAPMPAASPSVPTAERAVAEKPDRPERTTAADPPISTPAATSYGGQLIQPKFTSFRATRPAGMERESSVAIFSAVLDAVHDPNQINGALYFLTDAGGAGPDIARLLLARGADPNTTIFYNVTPLMMVIYRSCGAAFAHALIESSRYTRFTPCSPTEVIQVVSLLLEHGARTDVRDSAGATPLMRAAETGDLEVVEQLVAHGADLNAKDNKRHSVMQYAKDGKGIEMAATGRKRGKANDDVIHFFQDHGLKN